MPRQIDIDWAARIMMGRHGKDAVKAAQRRISSLVEAEDIGTAAIWVRVERAIRVLQGPLFPAFGVHAAELEGPVGIAESCNGASDLAKILDLNSMLGSDAALLHPIKQAIPVLRVSARDLRDLVPHADHIKSAIYQVADKMEFAADELACTNS